MTGPLRRAGRGTDASEAEIVWTVSEGRRGRRWREVRSGPHGVITSLLLETDATGRISHVEISTAAGLLTLHPEADGTLHGNIVGERGIEHVEGLAWRDEAVVLLEGSLIARAAAIRTAAIGSAAIGTAGPESTLMPALHVDLHLQTRLHDVRITRDEGGRWLVGDEPALRVDPDGLPVLDGGSTWALEREP